MKTTKMQELLIAALSEHPAQAAFNLVKKDRSLIGWKPLEDLILQDTFVALQYLQRYKKAKWVQLLAALRAQSTVLGRILYEEALRTDGKDVRKWNEQWALEFAPRSVVVRVNFGGAK